MNGKVSKSGMSESASRIAFRDGMSLMEDVPTYRFKISPPVLDAYWMALELYSADVLRKAFAKAIREEKDLPSPATLVKHARAVRAEAQPRSTESMPPMSDEDKAAMQADIERLRRTGRFSVPDATGGQA